MRKSVEAEVDTKETNEKQEIWHETGGRGEGLHTLVPWSFSSLQAI